MVSYYQPSVLPWLRHPVRQHSAKSPLLEHITVLQGKAATIQNRLLPLFEDEVEKVSWRANRTQDLIEHVGINQLRSSNLFLGVESGSTTTKLVLIDSQGKVVF